LKDIPLNVGIPYLRWSIDLIFYYIKSSFGVEYSKTNYYNIYNKNIKYIDDNEIIDYINKNYKCWYNIDVFYVNEKSNEDSIKFLIIDDKDEVNRIFRNDFEEIRNNIEEQIDDKKVGIHSNHNKAME